LAQVFKFITMKDKIEKEIRKAINRHLVVHVQVPKEDNRDRIDILVDEAATEILKLVANPVLADSLPLHTCKYCGIETTKPDEECYKAP